MKKFSMKKLAISLCAGVGIACSGGAVALMDNQTAAAAEEKGKVEVYQLATNSTYLMQSYVIKTASGKLVVIDGGMGTVYDADWDTAKNAPAYLPAALRAIAGKEAGEEVEVEAWFLSHAHRDHYSELSKIMSTDDTCGVTINNFYFDFPDFGGTYPLVNTQQDDLDGLKVAFANSGWDYDQLNGAVINEESVEKGLTISVDGVHFDVLQTWDNSSGKYDSVNDTSLVIRMRTGDNSMLFLNDLGIEGGERLTATYAAEDLVSDYVQLGHHGNTGLTKAQYDTFITGSTKLLFPITDVCYNNPGSFLVDEVYEWFNGTSYLTNGVPDESKINKEKNFFACLYDSYPTDIASVVCWADCIEGMKVASFEYENLEFKLLGASVRTANPDGIRFVAQIADEAVEKYGENAKYGIILVPEDMDTGADLTLSYDGANYSLSNPYAMVIERGQWWSDDMKSVYGVKDGYSVYSSALIADQGDGETAVRFPAAFYNRPITAVGFVIPENGEIVYTEKVTRSIAYVASVETLGKNYETNEVVENIKAGANFALSVGDGEALTNLYKAYEPTLTLGNMDVNTSAAIKVSYASDNESVAKIVAGKVQPMGDGTATITAYVTIDGEKTIPVATQITVAVTKDVEWVTLNDATKDFMQYGNGSAVSTLSTAEDPVGAGYVKVTSQSDWGWFYLPLSENGAVVKARALQRKYQQFKVSIYAPNGLSGHLATSAVEVLPGGTGAGWHEVVFTTDQITTNYNDVAGLTVQFRFGGETVYFGQFLGLTSGPNYQPEQLETPTVEVWEDGTVVWTEVEGATAYAYSVDGLNFNVTTDTFAKVGGKSVVKVKALGDGNYYKDSAISQEPVYLKKDVLNSCENVGGWAEMYGEGATLTTSADYATQGYQGYRMTTSPVNGWATPVVYLRKDGAPLTLEQLYAYKYIAIDVHADATSQALNFYFYGALICKIEPNQTKTIRISSAALKAEITTNSAAYNPINGAAIFQLQSYDTTTFAPAIVYIDNIVGVSSKTGATSMVGAEVVNDCESVGGWMQAATTPTLSTLNVFEGTYSVEATSASGWWWLNVRILRNGLTLDELQKKYDVITLNIYSDYPNDPTWGAANSFYLGNGEKLLTRLAYGDNVVTVNTADLTSTSYVTDGGGGYYINFYVGGACTLRIDNVVAEKQLVGGVNFGNALILGDSYSTYAGWIPYDEYAFYSDDHSDVYNVEDTWWHQVLTKTGSNLVYNNAIGGTTISYSGYDGQDYTSISFITRFAEMVNSGYFEENPVDTVFIFGGTNDAWAGAPLGSPKYGSWTTEDLFHVYPALCYLISAIKWHMPEAKIVVLGNVWGYELNASTAGMSDTFAQIASYYKNVGGFDIDYIPVYLTDADIVANHPNVPGMQKISDAILNYYQ